MKTLKKLKPEVGLWASEDQKPEPGHNELRIKVLKTAICGTDLHIYKWDAWSQANVPIPLTIGHEFVGVVDALGTHVTGFTVGQRVSAEGHITCGHCRNCRAGNPHLCPQTEGIGVHRPGAFAEYITVPAQNAYHIPDTISLSEAALLDPFGNAVHATLSFDLVGEDVLITGAGPIGLMSTAIARHVGARHIVVTDVNPYRLALAKTMGATRAIHATNTSLTDVMSEIGMKEGFDVGLEMSGQPAAFQSLLESMNTGGKIAFLGIPSNPFPIDWSTLIFKNITLQGIYGRKIFETWYKGVSMLQSGLDITPVITAEHPHTEFETAFQTLLAGNAAKIILNWAA